MTKRVVIVGAGPGGLSSAMLLAKAGLDVTVVERRGRVGGRTSTLFGQADGVQGEFKFDLGPTFFLYPRILEELFAMCGDDLHERVEMVRLDPQYRLLFERPPASGETSGGIDVQLDCTANISRMVEQIAQLNVEDAQRFPKFVADNRKKFAAFTPILQKDWGSLAALADPSLMEMLPLVRPWASVDADLKRYFKDPRVRLAFSFQSKYLGMSPFKCPSLFTILSYLEYDFGVFHPRGGCGAVSDAMAEAARDLGVAIELDADVKALDFAPGSQTCTGLTYRDAGGVTHSLDADAVVVNADFAHAMSKLVPDRLRTRWTDKKIAAKKYSCSTYMLYLGVTGEPEHYSKALEHHNIFLAHDYPTNLDQIENQHVLSENPSVYLQHPGHTDPTMAPDGHTALYVLAPVTHETTNVDWRRDAPKFRKTVFNQLAKLGLPDLESRVVYEKQLTPSGWRDDLAIFRGATFNLAHNLGQMLNLRPNNRFEDLDGVYLVGGGTHPGSGLPVIYEGARISAKLLCDDLGVTTNWEAPEPKSATPGYGTFHASREPAMV
ncbi:MAG: phytoene desaturase family protein [Planctomycetota bacterium]